MKPPRLDRKEWYFDAMPSAEIIPCCYWEYARESRTIWELIEQYASKRLARVPSDLNGHSFVLYVAIRAKMFDQVRVLVPWQTLPDQDRKHLASYYPLAKSRKSQKGNPRIIAPATACTFTRADWFDFEEMVRPYLETLINGRRSSGVSEPGPKFDCGLETGAFTIDWKENDDAIKAAFTSWLKLNRPKDIKAADGRGRHLNHYQTALRRLGVMRRVCADPTEGDAELNKEVRRALLHFREFVDGIKGEMPIHWPANLGTERFGF